MPAPTLKRSRQDANASFKPKKRIKKFKKQLEYHSSSEDDDAKVQQNTYFNAVNLQDSDEENETASVKAKSMKSRAVQFVAAPEKDDDREPSNDQRHDEDGEAEAGPESDGTGASSDSEQVSDSQSETSTNAERKLNKRNDPSAFATSISRILSSKLSTSKRSDPVLSRSKSAADASKSVSESRLEARARHKLLAEKKAALDKGRVRDVMGLESTETSTQEILEREKRLRKTAQRGVVKLFNAVRQAQVRAEEAAKTQQKQGVVGIQKREGKMTEMSKQGFLDLIAGGGKTGKEKGRAGSMEV